MPAPTPCDPVPAAAGIGLRAPHYRALLETRPAVGWLEVHSENYFGDGGPPLFYLEQARAHYPLSLHGVGLSLGSGDPLDMTHLRRLKALIRRFEPGLVSEHLCWSSIGGRHLNDLLPLPYTDEALEHAARRIAQVQDFLGREILIENVSSYLQYRHSAIPEWEFLRAVAQAAGCGILLDVNNVHVSCANHGLDPYRYVRALTGAPVRELHLAGFAANRYGDREVLIDHHGAPVSAAVWALYRATLAQLGPLPTLIEWDTDIPALEVLLREAAQADAILGATPMETTRAVPA